MPRNEYSRGLHEEKGVRQIYGKDPGELKNSKFYV